MAIFFVTLCFFLLTIVSAECTVVLVRAKLVHFLLTVVSAECAVVLVHAKLFHKDHRVVWDAFLEDAQEAGGGGSALKTPWRRPCRRHPPRGRQARHPPPGVWRRWAPAGGGGGGRRGHARPCARLSSPAIG